MTDLTATTIAEYAPVEAGLAELRSKYVGIVWDVSTLKGLEAAKAARAEVRAPRYEIEAMRKALKAPAIAYGKRIDDEAKRITAELLAIEGPIDEVVKAEEDRKEQARLAKVAAEAARVASIQQKIAAITNAAVVHPTATAEAIDVTWNTIRDCEITSDEYQEFVEQAQHAKQESLTRLNLAFEQALQKEAETRKLQAEREELERQREELEAQRKADEQRKAQADAEEKAQRDAAAAELKRQQDELKRQQDELAAAKRKQDEEAARLVRERQADEKRRRDEEAQRLEDARKMQEGIERAAREKRKAEEQAEREADEKRRAAAARLVRASQRPKVVEVIDVIAKHYDIHADDARCWLIDLGTEAELLGALAEAA